MHTIHRSTTFRKDIKRVARNPHFRKTVFLGVIDALARGETLAPQYRNHKLMGEFSGCFECHLQPDLLLIYLIDRDAQAVRLIRIGSHAELFG